MSTKTIEDTTTHKETSHYPMYKCIMHNDDKTTMGFVIRVLVEIFNKKVPEARDLMMEIHETGSGLAGVYALEHAELKRDQTHSKARTAGFPLTCTIEPA